MLHLGPRSMLSRAGGAALLALLYPLFLLVVLLRWLGFR